MFSLTVSTALVSGSAQTVSLTANGLPAGAIASFAPPNMTVGTASTLTLSVGVSTGPGTYPIIVTGTGTSATHAVTVMLTVTARPVRPPDLRCRFGLLFRELGQHLCPRCEFNLRPCP
jgi:hypothetical protein